MVEASASRLRCEPSAVLGPDCYGHLHKLSPRWHRWQRRYCVLKDACLYIYTDPDARHAMGQYSVLILNLLIESEIFVILAIRP